MNGENKGDTRQPTLRPNVFPYLIDKSKYVTKSFPKPVLT